MASNEVGAGEQIKLLIERAQRIKAKIKDMQADEKDVYNEAKSRGFDVPTIKRVMKWLETDKNKRDEMVALDEVYKAALGYANGSLSDLAREFLDGKRGNRPGNEEEDGQLDAFKTPREPKGDGSIPEDFGEDLSDKPLTVEDAERLGIEAAKAGKPVTHNPFRAGDDKRAAWDAGWCKSLGSDGMDVPPELRPTPKPPKDDDKPKKDS